MGESHPRRIPAKVSASLLPGELTLLLHPGEGLGDGGHPKVVPCDRIPLELRMPNTRLWIEVDEEWNVLGAWERDSA